MATPTPLLKVRTITTGVTLGRADFTAGLAAVERAATFNAAAAVATSHA